MTKQITRPQIREVFMRNGAVIPADRDDLPDYVYEAAFELLEMAAPAVQGEPEAHIDMRSVDTSHPLFEPVWQAIKSWDISRDGGRNSYAGATGTDVQIILDSIAAPQPVEQEPVAADSIHRCVFVMRQIGAMSPDDIDMDHIEIWYEDEHGHEGRFDASIVEYADMAADLLENGCITQPVERGSDCASQSAKDERQARLSDDSERQAPDVAGLVEALEGALNGRPLDTEFWDRCEQFISAHRQGAGNG